MIRATSLTKKFGPVTAVDDLSLTVAEGEVVGFLGPNGAGKTTTLRMLTGAMPPTSGSATLGGFDVLHQAAEARRRLGYLPEGTPLYPEMRVTSYLHFVARLQGLSSAERRKRVNEVIDVCGLEPVRKRTIQRLSKGNRQRVGLASTLVHRPAVLVLDEPTSGLDPSQTVAVRQLLGSLRGDHTVLLSSHLLPEVQRMADRVLILARGRLVAAGTVDELTAAAVGGRPGAEPVRVEVGGERAVVESLLRTLDPDVELQPAGEGWWSALVRVAPGLERDAREIVAAACVAAGLGLRELRREQVTLESLFVRLTDPSAATATRSGAAASHGEAA